jgi:hypothetical protein
MFQCNEYGITGLLYDHAYPHEFSQFIFKLKDNEYRSKLADHAGKVSQMADWETPDKQLLDFYKKTWNHHLHPKVLKGKTVI